MNRAVVEKVLREAFPHVESTDPVEYIAALKANKLIEWRARAWDGVDYSAWSDFCWFIIDASKPDPSKATMTSGKDVVYSHGQRIDVRISTKAPDTNYFRYSVDGWGHSF